MTDCLLRIDGFCLRGGDIFRDWTDFLPLVLIAGAALVLWREHRKRKGRGGPDETS